MEKLSTIKLSYNDVHELVNHIASCINIKAVDVIVPLIRGGMNMANQLSRVHNNNKFVLPFAIRTTNTDEVEAKKSKPKVSNIIRPIVMRNTIAGKNILVVDEICDSGATLHKACKEIAKYNPSTITTAVCCLNTIKFQEAKGKYPSPDVIAKYVDKWVEFPWEVNTL